MATGSLGCRVSPSIAAAWCVLAVCSSCNLAPKSGSAVQPIASSASQGADDGGAVHYVNPFEPERVHVHGLTGMTIVNGEPRINAHIELFDVYGQSVKALGSCVFQLYAGVGSGGDLGEQLNRWVVDLSDPATNAAAYDRVTRTYRVALTDAPPPEAMRGYVLKVQFRSIAGTMISAQHSL